MSCLECTIVVAGELGDGFSGAFGGLTMSRESGTTRLAGTLADQAELEGVMHQLFGLALEIRSIAAHPGERRHG
jgi:hypothetical protein